LGAFLLIFIVISVRKLQETVISQSTGHLIGHLFCSNFSICRILPEVSFIV